ncbi:MAG: hypothetical protein QW208_03230 [Acidilobaceae archaeon]
MSIKVRDAKRNLILKLYSKGSLDNIVKTRPLNEAKIDKTSIRADIEDKTAVHLINIFNPAHC